MDNKKRHMIQGAAALLQNANFKGFFTGNISQAATKKVCVPGLNCYSCPGAVGACPLGSLQNGLSAYKFKFPYYVVGLLLFFGALLGRLICGFLCPFGLIQDLINKIPFPKKIKTFKGDRQLRYLKYIILIVMVLILPVAVKLTPFFCKYICPSGTIAGILLTIADSEMTSVLGGIFTWKLSILIAIILLCLKLARPFCKYLCPLGAIYGMCNKVSLVKMNLDENKCVHCNKCLSVCDMNVNPSVTQDSAECIRCGKCVNSCPADALSIGIIRSNVHKP